MGYTIERTYEGSFDDAIDAVTEALAEEGFGVLSEIDMQQTLDEKLGREFRRYTILGACNPPLASDALDTDIAVGALLPCNVVVYETDGDVVVAAVNPETLLGVAGDELDGIGADVKARLEAALDAV